MLDSDGSGAIDVDEIISAFGDLGFNINRWGHCWHCDCSGARASRLDCSSIWQGISRRGTANAQGPGARASPLGRVPAPCRFGKAARYRGGRAGKAKCVGHQLGVSTCHGVRCGFSNM